MAATLYAASCMSNIQPAYNLSQNSATIRLEGSSKLTDKVKCYGFTDVDAVEDSADLENFYAEARLSYSINDILALAAEYNGGNNLEDTVRLGFVVTPKTFKGNFTMFKFYPYETNGSKGPQVCFFTSQELTDKIIACLTVDYNIDLETISIEPELDYKVNERLTAFLQGRRFGPIDNNIDFALLIGVKCK